MKTTLALLTVLLASRSVAQAANLHEQIDAAIAAQAKTPIAPTASDEEFLRRAWLDLAGTIPPADQVQPFIADTAPDKRQKLIDRLLAGADYARRMREAWTVMLLERRTGTTVPDAAWNAYLEKAFAENRPWDQLVRELLGADGSDAATQPAIRFLIEGGRQDADQAVLDVGRLLLGVNLQCAHCHDHPSVKEYRQADYYGLLAYLGQSKLHVDKEKRALVVQSPLKAKLEFKSVFLPNENRATGPRMPGGTEVEIPTFPAGHEFAQPPKDGNPGVPKFMPRKVLAENLPTAANRRFVLNAVNRFWFLMMGRGLVHPLDLQHAENQPSHPALLNLLADEFVRTKFDVKQLLRELALSQTYQRSSLVPEGAAADKCEAEYTVAVCKPLSAEQMTWSMLQATGNLERIRTAKPAANAKPFTYKDYSNGRLPVPENLGDIMTLFAAVFGSPVGESEEDFRPSVEQTLLLTNDRLVRSWLEPRDDNLIGRLAKLSDADAAIADELYRAILSRRPVDAETAEVVEYLKQQAARRPEAIADLAFALLTSAEFRLNH